jgi:ribosome-binding factor A
MQPQRRARLASVILQEMASVIPREVKDPRVPSLTFTNVEVTQDGGQATVFFMLLGGRGDLSEKEADRIVRDCITGLTSASGFLRRHLSRALSVRQVPTLIFKEDRGLENATRVHELLRQIGTGDGTPSDQGSSS